MSEIQTKITHAVQEFNAKIQAIANEMAVEMVTTTIGANKTVKLTPVKHGAAHASNGDSNGHGTRVKRDAESIEQIQQVFLAYVEKNPGQRIEQIKREIGLDTKTLMLPVRKLVEAKSVKTKGERRATVYFPKG